jgi:hypothetical protein
MSAVYHPQAFQLLVGKHTTSVREWFQANAGSSIEACATDLSLPYEVVYQVASQTGLVIVPSTSGEIHWHAGAK